MKKQLPVKRVTRIGPAVRLTKNARGSQTEGSHGRT